MNSRSYALRAGLFVVIFTVAILLAAFWISGNHKPRNHYVVVTQGSVFGLKPQSTVFFRGITAGIVNRIIVDPRNPRTIAIFIAVDQSIPVTRGTYAELKLQGVTGLSALELDTTSDMAPLPTSRTHPGRIPMRASLLTRLSRAGTRAITQLARLSDALQKTLDARNRAHFSEILAHAAQASAQWVALTAQLNKAAAQLPLMESKVNITLTRLNALTQEMRVLGKNLNALSKTAQGVGNIALTRTLPRVDRALAKLAAASSDVQRLSRSLRHHPRELLLGTRPMAPGPGEPGYKESR